MKDKIIEKFRNELENARNYKPADDQNKQIRLFESAIKYLPDEIKMTLEVELKY